MEGSWRADVAPYFLSFFSNDFFHKYVSLPSIQILFEITI